MFSMQLCSLHVAFESLSQLQIWHAATSVLNKMNSSGLSHVLHPPLLFFFFLFLLLLFTFLPFHRQSSIAADALCRPKELLILIA
jgi:hypothetical protein